MGFRFALEAVLHYRRSLEHQQELRLRAIYQQVAAVRHAIDRIDKSMRRMEDARREQLHCGTTAAELRFAQSCVESMQRQRAEAERNLKQLHQLCEQQRKIFERARRERETFESLRERLRREYEREAARRAQRQLDDLFLLRRVYLRHG
ncbi:MAG TPA: flagellar export protein FliJ [Silvibacterium sp.]|nr:flagellar export protein FliJ [Silvibacterium sp.]